MLRKLFISSTLFFWLIVAGFWLADFLAPPKPAPPVPTAGTLVENSYPLADIASHNREEDCWMVIEGQVYDITAYLPDHPSEPEFILPWCGKDATQAWLTKNRNKLHSARASALLEKYRIGKMR